MAAGSPGTSPEDAREDALAGSPHPAPADVRDLLTFRIAILAATNDRIGHSWMVGRYGVRIMEWRALALIATMQPVAFGDLVRALRIDKGQLSRLLKALGDKELVTATPDPADRRVKHMRLTPRGRAVHDEVFAEAHRRNARIVSAALTPEETRTLFALLDKLQPFMDERAADLEAPETENKGPGQGASAA